MRLATIWLELLLLSRIDTGVAMLAIRNIDATGPASARRPIGIANSAVAAPIASTALVPIAPAAPSERPLSASRRPVAAFVAQLIATRQRAPQTRARRRAHPAEAVAAYRWISELPAETCVALRSL